MIQTINISLPRSLSNQIRLEVKKGGYVSISEFIREAVRNYFRNSIAFSEKAEEEILKISEASSKNDLKFDSQKTPVAAMFKKIDEK